MHDLDILISIWAYICKRGFRHVTLVTHDNTLHREVGCSQTLHKSKVVLTQSVGAGAKVDHKLTSEFWCSAVSGSGDGGDSL